MTNYQGNILLIAQKDDDSTALKNDSSTLGEEPLANQRQSAEDNDTFGLDEAIGQDSDTSNTEQSESITEITLPAAVQWYLEKAEQGDADSQYNLGSIYETGFGVEINYKAAAKWYGEAAKQGHRQAQLKLGILYTLGKGVRESTIKGGKWIRAAAKQDSIVAKLLQDEVLSHNVEQNFDVKKVVNEVRLGLVKGETNAEEILRLALRKSERKLSKAPQKSRFTTGVTGSGAKRGTVDNRVPSFLDKNTKNPAVEGQTFADILRRANDGDAKSQYELANMYTNGLEVERSRAEAINWYTQSADQSYGPSQYQLGLAYLYGDGVKKDLGVASQWLNKAKSQKEPAASQLLNYISQVDGIKIEKSIVLSWYLERSLKGNGEAMLALGNMFENGWGIEKNPAEAKNWYVKARIAGTKGAAIQLRRMKADSSNPDDERAISTEQRQTDPQQVVRQTTPASVKKQNPNVKAQVPGRENDNLLTKSTAPAKQSSQSLNSKANSENSMDAEDNRDSQGIIVAVKRKIFGSSKEADRMINKLQNNPAPIALMLVGIIMGVLVFRWMRKSDSVF